MSRYRTVQTATWHDPKVRALDPSSKCLWLYLLTAPNSHLSGLHRLPIAYVTSDTGLTERQVKAAYKKLTDAGLILVDEVLEIVWVRKFHAHQVNGVKARRSVEAWLKTIGRIPLTEQFCKEYGYPIDTLSIPYRYPISDPKIGLCTDSDSDSDSDSESDSENYSQTSFDPALVFDAWNKTCCPPLRRVTKRTKQRRGKVLARARYIEQLATLDGWEDLFGEISRTPFLLGDSERGWSATFDWVVRNDENPVKILEGVYRRNRKLISDNDKGQYV